MAAKKGISKVKPPAKAAIEVKKTVEKPVIAKPVAVRAIAPKKPSGNKNSIIAIAAVVIVGIAIAAFFMMSGGPSPIAPVPPTPPTPKETLPLMQLVPGLENVVKNSKKVTAEGAIQASISGGDSAISAMSVSMGFKAAFDRDAMKAYSKMTASVLGMDQVTETYVIENDMYIGTKDPYSGELFWMKQAGSNDTWSNYDPEIFVGMLKSMSGTITGSETINGKETQKISVTPDLGAMITFMLEYQYGSNLSAMGLTQADLDGILAQVRQATKTADFTLWVEKGTFVPVKMEGNLILEIDLNAFSGGMATGVMVVSARPSVTFDFTSPVIITLPAEALNATSVEDLNNYAGVCGDGICGEYEDGSTCPEDCGDGQLVGNDIDSHGCIPSAGYSWCEVSQKCLRPWEEGCNPSGCIDKCGDGTCEEIVCMAIGCPCAETAGACPEDCE